MDPLAQDVLDYWLGQPDAPDSENYWQERKAVWFMAKPEVDAEIRERFGTACEALVRGDLDRWQAQPLEALAGIILGDQFSRNAFRGSPKMYAADDKTLAWARQLVASGADRAALNLVQRIWVSLPFMHNENLEDQDVSVRYYEELAKEAQERGLRNMAVLAAEGVQYAAAHRAVVARWGRFPHRNAILGRESTPEEAAGIANGSIPKW